MTHRHAQSEKRTILLLGNRRQSLTVIRSLAACGWNVMVAVNQGDDRDYHAYRSKFAASAWHHNDYRKDAIEFRQQLLRLLETTPEIDAVFPVDEAAIRCIKEISSELANRVKVVMANSLAVESCLDKLAMFQLCQSIGVPTHPFIVTNENTNWQSACSDLGLPCIIKPLDRETIWFGKKAAIVREAEEVNELSEKIDNDESRLVVQRFATGPRHNVYFAAVDGKILASVEVLIGRTDRYDGTGLAVSGKTISPTSELTEDTGKIAAELNYTGVGCAQFLMDPQTGQRNFLELNPRLGANFAAVHAAGLPLAQIATEIVYPHSAPSIKTPFVYPIDQRFAWTFGDLAGLRFEFKHGTIGPWQAIKRLVLCARDAIFSHNHITMSWDDPKPTLFEFMRAFGWNSNRESASRDQPVLPQPLIEQQITNSKLL